MMCVCSLGLMLSGCFFLSAAGTVAETITVDGDDSSAIAAAITQAQPGDTVLLPSGTYNIQTAVKPESGTHMKGAGQDRTVLHFVGQSPSAMLDLSDCEDAEVSHLTLDAALNTSATQGVYATNARRLNIHHVTIRNLGGADSFGPHGILFSGQNPTREKGVTDSIIADCTIENIAVGKKFGSGIRMAWGSSRNRILRNTVSGTGRGGIFGDNGSTDLVIQGNTVAGSGGEGLGIEVWGGCDRATIEGNRIDHWLSIGGCDYAAVRGNTISEKSGTYKFCGIEGIGSYCVYADNIVDGGAKIGLSVSGKQPKEHVLWSNNTVRGCNQWGSQFQGEAGGIAYHYLYNCTFESMPVSVGPVWYPGDEGHGFRINGNTRHVTFEECQFTQNARLGIQCCGTGIDGLSFVKCAIAGNRGGAMSGPGDYTALDWSGCTVSGNGSDAVPPAKPFRHPAPTVSFEAPATARVGESVSFKETSEGAQGAIAAVLWDFGAGVPSTDKAPSHTYGKIGTHSITLIAWDEAGRAGRAERTIEIGP
jgi:PKD domain/Right handed beta helix region